MNDRRALALSRLLVLLLVGWVGRSEATEPLWRAESAGDLRGVEVYDDVDGDGSRDLLVIGTEGARIYHAGEPASGASILQSHPGAWPFNIHRRMVGDLDASGEPDAVVSVPVPLGNTDMAIWLDVPGMDPVLSLDAVDPGRLDYTWRISRYRDVDFQQDGYADFAMSSYDGTDGWFYAGDAIGPLQKTLLNGFSEKCRAAEIVPDINGDGYPDLLTAHEDIYQYPAFVDIRFGGPGADLDVDLRVELPTSLGAALAVNVQIVSLDFDGDGQLDFAVTGPTNSFPVQPGTGLVLIYRGGTALDDAPDFVLRAPPRVPYFGEVLGQAGDTNGDGYEDLAVALGSGAVFVYFGGPQADTIPDAWFVAEQDQSGVDWTMIRPLDDWDGDGGDEVLFGGSVFSPGPFDCNGDGTPDLDQPDVMEDCDGSSIPDLCEIQRGWATDCDGNLRIDSCEMSEAPALDCNDNNRLDICDVAAINVDCDRNGQVDSCELAEDPSLDCNGDGGFDACQLDEASLNCNANGFIDSCEDHGPNTFLDCDGDGSFDTCQIAGDPGLDLDANGRLDGCDGPLRLRVAFDAAGEVTDLDVFGAGPIEFYVVFDATGAFPAGSLEQLAFEVVMPEQIYIVGAEVVAPGVTDLLYSSNTGYFLDVSGAVDPSRPAALVRLSGYALAGVEDARIALAGSSLEPWLANPTVPYWTDGGGQRHIVDRFLSAFVNRGFDDCNGNELDDLIDIAYAYAPDENGNLVLDMCEGTAAPAARTGTRLFANRPNPFNPRTTLRFELEQASTVRLEIFDAAGRRVRTLLRGRFGPGLHARDWDGTDDRGATVASGVYFVVLTTENVALHRRMALIR